MRNYEAMEKVKEMLGNQKYFTTRQAGTILGVSKAQIQKWVSDGVLNIGEHKFASHIKIAQYDLLHFIAENHYEEYVLNLPGSFTVPELCKKVGLTKKWYYESLGEGKVAQPLHSPIRLKHIKYEDVKRMYEDNANDLSKREIADFLKKLEVAYNEKINKPCEGVTKIVMGGNGKDHSEYHLDTEKGTTDEGVSDNETGGVPDILENEDGLIKNKKGPVYEVIEDPPDLETQGINVLGTDADNGEIVDKDTAQKVCEDFMNMSEGEVKASVGISYSKTYDPKRGDPPVNGIKEVDLTDCVPAFKESNNISPLQKALVESAIKLRSILITSLNSIEISSLSINELWDIHNNLIDTNRFIDDFQRYTARKA